MTDKPIDPGAREARDYLRMCLRMTKGTAMMVANAKLGEVLDALDAANVEIETSKRQHGDTVKSFLWVQELQTKYKGHSLLEPLLTKHWGGQIGRLAEELVDLLFAELAGLRDDVRSAEKGSDEWKSKALASEKAAQWKTETPPLVKLAQWVFDFSQRKDETLSAAIRRRLLAGDSVEDIAVNLLEVVTDNNREILKRHTAYVKANPAPIRLEGGQVVRFVSPVTPQEVQILSEEPFAMAEQTVAAEIDHFEITGQAETILPESVDMLPSLSRPGDVDRFFAKSGGVEVSPIMPEIADMPAAQEAHAILSADISDGRPLFRAVWAENPESLQEIGASFLTAIDENRSHPLLKDWAPMQDPAEIVSDLLNAYDEKRIAWVYDNDALLRAAREVGETLKQLGTRNASSPHVQVAIAERVLASLGLVVKGPRS